MGRYVQIEAAISISTPCGNDVTPTHAAIGEVINASLLPADRRRRELGIEVQAPRGPIILTGLSAIDQGLAAAQEGDSVQDGWQNASAGSPTVVNVYLPHGGTRYGSCRKPASAMAGVEGAYPYNNSDKKISEQEAK